METKNYIKEVAEMLGVDIGEEFDIVNRLDNGPIAYSPYHFTEKSLMDAEGDRASSKIACLITGDYIIKQTPWKPVNGECFYYVTAEGNVANRTWMDVTLDYLLFNSGNCFKYKDKIKPHMIEEIQRKTKEAYNA